MAKSRRKTDNQTHLKSWREDAAKLGWSAEDIEQFHWLHIASDPDAVMVLEVQGDRIIYRVCWLFRSDGIGTGGIKVSRWISQTRERHWMKSISIPNAIRSVPSTPEDERGKWCPCHGYAKSPMCSICGFNGLNGPVITLETCACRQFDRKGSVIHAPDCLVSDIHAEGLLDDGFFDVDPAAADPATEIVAAEKPAAKLEFGVPLPKQKRKKQVKKTLDSLTLGTIALGTVK